MNQEARNATWTTRRLLEWTGQHLKRCGVDNSRLASEMLLAHVLGVPRLKLYMDPHRPATDLERATFRELVERAAKHEPADYLVGHAPFFSMSFKVNRTVLIPRPSTETVVEHIIQHARRTPGYHAPLIADVCTGSGAIAIALAKHMPHAHIIATDLYEDALAVAHENARQHDVADRIAFRQGDLLEPLQGERVRYLVSNPPYISDAEWDEVEPNVKDHEPEHALRGGADGLRDLRNLLSQARQYLDRPAQVVFEIAASQKKAVLALAAQNTGLTNAHVLADHEGLPRVLVADAR